MTAAENRHAVALARTVPTPLNGHTAPQETCRYGHEREVDGRGRLRCYTCERERRHTRYERSGE